MRGGNFFLNIEDEGDGSVIQGRKLLNEITAAKEGRFPSTGRGTDHRFKGKAPASAAQVHQGAVVDAALCRLDGSEGLDRVASFCHERKCVATGWDLG